MRCRISRCVAETIRSDARAAAPREACGLLFGAAREITAAQVAENVSETPETRFEIDPRALFAAMRSERSGGPEIAGYWHSHPSGDATPSATDAAMAAPDGKLWLIVAGEAITAWQAGEGGLHGRFEAVELAVED
ncbi:M67 family metallopeptidase [Sphingomonas sp. AOB5]|uniref:M67 family metallopeptidase n=1 Tax=Sphingomonas sp. AOB5 TaxID=3034017 RepID=UPI0023F71DEC|nr:M67 family metallopeptidase [Sphingomonas sp. AOB5]MDF7776242.1 M67 family metallopeptidase [Sphingomonas sp. AOB5]